MSKRILLFPGQGSQKIGMAKSFMENSVSAELLKQANDVLGFDLMQIMFEGPEEELKKTENTQPALFVASQMAFACLQESATYDYVSGHSLGEYSALCAAGAITYEDGLKIVRKRGELMAQAGEISPGAMSAILGPSSQEVTDLVNQIPETVGVANYNSPSQTVISGTVKGIEIAEQEVNAIEAKKVVRLPVSGAFHSPLMEFAVEGLQNSLDEIDFNSPTVPVISNVTAEPESDSQIIKKNLIDQLTASVRWVECIQKAIVLGCTEGIELGSGKVLMGLCRGISRELKVHSIDNIDDLHNLKEMV